MEEEKQKGWMKIKEQEGGLRGVWRMEKGGNRNKLFASVNSSVSMERTANERSYCPEK